MYSEWKKDKLVKCKNFNLKWEKRKLNVDSGSQLQPGPPPLCSAVSAQQICGEPAPVCHCHPAWMGVSTGGHRWNESDPSLSAGERSWTAQPNASEWWLRQRGASVGALYPGHPSLWKLHWFHHHLALSAGLKWGKFLVKHSSGLSLFGLLLGGPKKLHQTHFPSCNVAKNLLTDEDPNMKHLNGNMKHSVAVADLKHAHN